ELLSRAIDLVDEAWPYVLAVPGRALRLRLACVWPLWVGLGTLAKLRAAGGPPGPGAAGEDGPRAVDARGGGCTAPGRGQWGRRPRRRARGGGGGGARGGVGEGAGAGAGGGGAAAGRRAHLVAGGGGGAGDGQAVGGGERRGGLGGAAVEQGARGDPPVGELA